MCDRVLKGENMSIEQLEKLKRLKDKGVITEEEFQEQKRNLFQSNWFDWFFFFR